MAVGPDRPKTSEQQLSEIAGITAPLRQQWANKGRLRKGGRGGYDEKDAIELGAFKALMQSLGPSDAPIAWKQLREPLIGRASERHLLAMFDVQDKTASLVSSIPELEALATESHPILIVALSDPIRRVRRAFALITTDL